MLVLLLIVLGGIGVWLWQKQQNYSVTSKEALPAFNTPVLPNSEPQITPILTPLPKTVARNQSELNAYAGFRFTTGNEDMLVLVADLRSVKSNNNGYVLEIAGKDEIGNEWVQNIELVPYQFQKYDVSSYEGEELVPFTDQLNQVNLEEVKLFEWLNDRVGKLIKVSFHLKYISQFPLINTKCNLALFNSKSSVVECQPQTLSIVMYEAL